MKIGNIFFEENVNIIFNNFLNTYLSESSTQVFQLLNQKTPINQNHG